MLRALLMCCFILTAPAPAIAQSAYRGDARTIASALAYLDAYQALDLERLEAFYAEDAAFHDPTSLRASVIGGPFVWRGRDEIMAGIRAWTESVSSLNYDVEDVYEASGRVVILGAVNPVVATPSGSAQFHYRIVTIVTVEDGLVREHRDYTDYAGVKQVH